MKTSLFSGAALVLALFAASVPAQTPGTPWDQLKPEQQQLLLQMHQERWNALSAERQQRMLEGAERWQKMTPEERRRIQARHEKFKHMTPEQRAQMRERIRARREAFERLPPERQQAIRDCKQRRRAGEDVDCRGLWPERHGADESASGG
ncbi:MAG TPA: DUF3106 domain-containing protein [Nevskiales bacterium]|nr:DUF3106 domain-containing protein [Nevskiales bacterium]